MNNLTKSIEESKKRFREKFGVRNWNEDIKQVILKEILKCKPEETKCLHIDFWEKDIKELFK